MKHAPTAITQFRRLCADCGQYKPTVSGSRQNPAHSKKRFVCYECVRKEKPA